MASLYMGLAVCQDNLTTLGPHFLTACLTVIIDIEHLRKHKKLAETTSGGTRLRAYLALVEMNGNV